MTNRTPLALTNGIRVHEFDSPLEASHQVASEIADLIRSRQGEGRQCVLGLATGSTPQHVYAELIRFHREESLSFANVVTFNLDEYWPMQPEDPQSYVRFMNESLFDHVDVKRINIHIPDGTLSSSEVDSFCDEYENRIADSGGIDLQLLGIGRTGHIGFNDPGSDSATGTRQVSLNSVTRIDASAAFGGIENVPDSAITMGGQTILSAKRIRLLAFGERKASIVAHSIEGRRRESVPATFLQQHPDVEFLLDADAASELDTGNRVPKNS
jgi:glucosamine-6-phosphate deaminase